MKQSDKIAIVKQWIQEHGYSNREVARILGVSHPVVSRWRAGGKIKDSHWARLKRHIYPVDPTENVPVDLVPLFRLLGQISENFPLRQQLLSLVEESVKSQISIFKKLVESQTQSSAPEEVTPRVVEEKPASVVRSCQSLPVLHLSTSPVDQFKHEKWLAAGGSGVVSERDYDFCGYVREFHNDDSIILVEVVGASMSPVARHGDLLAVRTHKGGIHFTPEGRLTLNTVRALVPDNTMALMSSTFDDELTVKRIRYWETPGTDQWSLYIHCDNQQWGEENGIPPCGRKLRMGEELHIHGTVIGRVIRAEES